MEIVGIIFLGLAYFMYFMLRDSGPLSGFEWLLVLVCSLPGLYYTFFHRSAMKQRALADQKRHEQFGQHTVRFVTYLGGHPEFRTRNLAGALIITRKCLYFAHKASLGNPNGPLVHFYLPFERILGTKSFADREQWTTWSSSLPIPLTFTIADTGVVVVGFVNDVGDQSTVGFSPGNSESSMQLNDEIYGAIYDWKKSVQRA